MYWDELEVSRLVLVLLVFKLFYFCVTVADVCVEVIDWDVLELVNFKTLTV